MQQAFGFAAGFSLEDTSKTPGAGDLQMRIGSLPTMWDAKSHTAQQKGSAELRNIEAKDIDKMRRDMLQHPEIQVGFLVALHTGIAKHAGQPMQLEFLNETQLLVYVNKLLDAESPVAMLQEAGSLLFPLAEKLKTAAEARAGDGSPAAAEAERHKQLQGTVQAMLNGQLAAAKAMTRQVREHAKASAAGFKQQLEACEKQERELVLVLEAVLAMA